MYTKRGGEFVIGNTKLKLMCESGKYTQTEIAKFFGVSRQRIHQLINLRNIIYRKPIGNNEYKRQISKQQVALAKLKRWQNSLTIEEKPRLNAGLQIEVRCAHCKQYFVPSRHTFNNRVSALRGQLGSPGTECRMYCSQECKDNCEVFNKKGDGTTTVRHERIDQPELRQMVFERDGYRCVQCGSNESLVCHHIKPVSMEPIESADIDNCITLCESCHNIAHTGACSRVNLRCKES